MKTIDDENKEFYLLGNLNANMLDVSNNATKHLNSIIELYQLSQTINSPTRVTLNSSSLIDVCLTPTPDKLILSRVVKTTISNHYMILIVRKINVIPKLNRCKKIKVRNFKHFNANNFHTDLRNQPWELISNYSDVDRMWDIWKTLFMDVLDRHAPLREKRVKNKLNVPWLTSEKNSSDINCINYKTHQISNPNELAECFNNYFTNIGPEIANSIDSSDVNFRGNIMSISSRFNFQTISVSKVHKFLTSLDPCKSTGIGKIPVKIVRIASPVIVKSITKIF